MTPATNGQTGQHLPQNPLGRRLLNDRGALYLPIGPTRNGGGSRHIGRGDA